jgi:hypothetical protein
MKKIILITAFFIQALIALSSQAQVSVNVNIGAQPLWGPVGYDYVEYYYMPQYDVYYYVPTHRFVYFDAGRWLFAPALPPRFGPVDFYSTYKVVINHPKAYLQHNAHKVEYVKYRSGGFNQVVIRNSDEPKYYVVKGHPHYAPPGQMKKGPEVKYKGEPTHRMEGPSPGSFRGPEPAHGGGNGHGQGGGHGGGKGKGH